MVGNSSSNTAGKPIRCKAAIVRKPGEPLVIEEVIVAPPKQREVRIKIICTSLCHSDLSFWKLKDLQINWYEALMKIHGRLKIGDSWIIQNHVWVLLKCVKLDSAQVFPPPYHWRSELELQALCSTI